jgi:flagellar biosynthetic protein FliQ
VNEADALDIAQAAIWTVIVASGPAVLAAMLVGVTIAISAPFIGAQISIFTDLVFSRIQSGF